MKIGQDFSDIQYLHPTLCKNKIKKQFLTRQKNWSLLFRQIRNTGVRISQILSFNRFRKSTAPIKLHILHFDQCTSEFLENTKLSL